MNVTIIGTGYVGLVTAVCLAEKKNKVRCIDTDEAKITKLQHGETTIYEKGLEHLMKKNKRRLQFSTPFDEAYDDTDIIMIATGTPENPDGSANLQFVYSAAAQIAKHLKNECTIVIKSTVPVGTNEKISDYIQSNLCNNVCCHFASNPEFLAQGSAVKDTLCASRIIIGTNDIVAMTYLTKLYKNFNSPIIYTSLRSAELIKYASNAFLALKLSYINEIANLCDCVGANIKDVTEGMSYDRRIGKYFLKSGVGYGGSCFPKDTKALAYMGKSAKSPLKTVESAIDVNNRQRFILQEKAKTYFPSFSGLKIAILGLTFKPGTDDIRESPAIHNIYRLLFYNTQITVWDPLALEKTRKIFGEDIQYKENIKEALKDADVCFIFTDWEEVLKLKPADYNTLMKTAYIFDGRNCYTPRLFDGTNVTYVSIGQNNT